MEHQLAFPLLLVLLLLLLFHPLPSTNSQPAANPPCPLNFTILSDFASAAKTANPCQYTLQALHLVQSHHLRTTSLFLPPPNSSISCWLAFQPFLSSLFPSFDPRRDCAFPTASISQGCMNLTSRSAFESLVPASAIADVTVPCNQSLSNASPCATCTTALSRIKAGYLPGPDYQNNLTDCASYPSIYASAVINPFGPTDPGTASCLFLLDANPAPVASSSRRPDWVYGASVTAVVIFVAAALVSFLYMRKRKLKASKKKKRKSANLGEGSVQPAMELESIAGHTTLVRYTIDDIKSATNNFSRENIIGTGGYGNVYKGVLPDGTEVAVKRFKNCSIGGDVSFAHEVEVIASVRHVSLVELKGYCIATSQLEGHQRIIVCELMRNGSLYDHLFGFTTEAEGRKLSWPVRQKIALGTARGLAYLHFGVQPAIIHRDVKTSNILLDERFEPKLADFGLAKFAPEGASHLSTRVAGTRGYVAPEYALYGKLTEKSDVFSFGVLLLEILSGKKAVVSAAGTQTFLLTDWAWSLVRTGRALDVVDMGMEELGPEDVMEKYVLVGVLCSHPHLHARPTMDNVVKILETSTAVPAIPDRPISIISDMVDIEKSLSSSGSGQLSDLAGYQTFTLDKGHYSSEF